MPVIVPITSSVKQTFTTQLGEWRFSFYFYYNVRSERWIFDVSDATTGLPLVLGQPFVLGQDFLEPYVFGIGGLFAWDRNVHHGEAGPNDLGTRVLMFYLTPDELAVFFPTPGISLPEPEELEPVVPVVRPIYGGVGPRGAVSGVLEGNTFVLDNNAVLHQLQTTAEARGQGWLFSPNNQAIYLLLVSGAWTSFVDDISKLMFPMNIPPIAVTVGERTMYLYQSTNALFDEYKPQVSN